MQLLDLKTFSLYTIAAVQAFLFATLDGDPSSKGPKQLEVFIIPIFILGAIVVAYLIYEHYRDWRTRRLWANKQRHFPESDS